MVHSPLVEQATYHSILISTYYSCLKSGAVAPRGPDVVDILQKGKQISIT